MTEAAAPGANADQIAYWNEAPGHTWAELQDRMDAQLEPLGEAVIAALAPRLGERILDIGCGCGQTTLALAREVGPGGEAVGADISRPMLEVAKDRPAPAGCGAVTYLEADAQTEAFSPASFDAAFSRFGVMFFEDSDAAFVNIRKALRPGGRLAVLCWRTMAENPMFTAPMAAALRHLPPPPAPIPGAPGPFAFSDPARVRAILEGSGFQDVAVTPLDMEISPGDVEDALALTLRVGPLGSMLRDHPEQREAVIDDLRAALAAHAPDGKVRFASATWRITAIAA